MPVIGLQSIVFGESASVAFEAMFDSVAGAGYEAIELGHTPEQRPASETRRLLDVRGLRSCGVHVGYEQALAQPRIIADYALALGSPMVIVSGVGDTSLGRRAYVEAGARLSEVGNLLQGDGLALAYHNHSFEFEVFDGRRGIDWLYDAMDPGCTRLCVDTYWVRHGGDDPVAWVKRHGSRIASLHLKDMAADAARSFVEIGQGLIDFRGVLREAAAAGIEWWTVEQDETKLTPERSIALSREGLRALGY